MQEKSGSVLLSIDLCGEVPVTAAQKVCEVPSAQVAEVLEVAQKVPDHDFGAFNGDGFFEIAPSKNFTGESVNCVGGCLCSLFVAHIKTGKEG
jgi:hypothetical protein